MDTLYIPPPQYQPQVPGPNPIVKIMFIVAIICFSLVSLFFLPVDIVAIKMSLDPGFTIFFILVLIVFIVKILNLAIFYMMAFRTIEQNYTWLLEYIVLVSGTLFIGGSLLVVAYEIYLLTKNIMAVLIHPFVIDFLAFMICNILGYIYIWTYTLSANQYYMVPQQPMFPMITMSYTQKEKPEKEDLSVQNDNRAFIPYYVSH